MLLTVRDLARELQVKPSTLYAWVTERKIPFVKLNGLIRFQREEITAWMGSASLQEKGNRGRSRTRRAGEAIDDVIARAKREVYTAAHGETRPLSGSIGKEVTDGAV